MSIFGAMFSGVSGLDAYGQSMGAIADNISNVNTTGEARAFVHRCSWRLGRLSRWW